MFINYIYLFFFFFLFFIKFIIIFFYNYIRIFTFSFISFIFLWNIWILLIYNKSILWYQYIMQLYWIESIQLSYIIGIDQFSLLFILLSTIIIMICLIMSWFLAYKINIYYYTLLLLLFILINTFIVMDILLFFLIFESSILPLFLLIAIWGSRSRKIYASYLLLSYTLLGSVVLLIVILYIYINIGTTNYIYFINLNLFTNKQIIIFICCFLGFGIKIPLIPFHIWLPEAHVESPTTGSVILAGLILKLGLYAIIKFLFFIINDIQKDVIYNIVLLSYFGFLYATLVAYNQIDLKKIIAYSSVAHMNFAILALFSESIVGLIGLVYLMIGHAFTSSALFSSIGVIYDRYKTRLICYYQSMIFIMPLLGIMFFIFIISNFAFPATINFVGELLILVGIINFNTFLFLLLLLPMVITMIYSLFLYNRIFFGPLYITFIRYYSDIIRIEAYTLLLFIIFVIIGGLYPMCIISLF